MSFHANYQGSARKYELELKTPQDLDQLGDRQGEVVDAVFRAVEEIVMSLGDCKLSVSASGHVTEGVPGDTIQITLSSAPDDVEDS